MINCQERRKTFFFFPPKNPLNPYICDERVVIPFRISPRSVYTIRER